MAGRIKKSTLRRLHYKRRKQTPDRTAQRDEVEVPDYVVGGGPDAMKKGKTSARNM